MNKTLNHYDGKIAGLYDLEETLGRGHFAVVKSARHVFTGEKVAVKVIDKNKLDDVSRAHLFQEVRCMKLVQHPNVVRLYEVIDTHTKLYLILELGDGGDLYDYIMRHEGGLTEQVARTYFRQIVKAISYCHRLHVVHRDLKPENVVFFEKLGTVKLTDFGFSNCFYPGQKLATSCGSLAYSAPEILLGESYDAPAVDVWSLGVILYMLVCGQAPFQEANDSETLTMIMDCKYSVPKHISNECKNLIAKMLVRQPDRRANLDDIAADKWLLFDENQDNTEAIPLVSREQVSEDNHNLIVTKMVNGNIATKEEIQEALDRNEYNHITATYFLLAERKLRAHQQELLLNIGTDSTSISVSKRIISNTDQSSLRVPCLSSNLNTQNVRSRKCSIVHEEEDEDVSSGKDEKCNKSILNIVNRRGSRSEGKLSYIFQEKFAQLSGKDLELKKVRSAHEDSSLKCKSSTVYSKVSKNTDLSNIVSSNTHKITSTRSHNPILNRENCEQRKIKIHKVKTTSCSSSDASDDDMENRKKRITKIKAPQKSLPKRRDSYDDSSDSQDPGSSSIGCGRVRSRKSTSTVPSSSSNYDKNQDNKNTTTKSSAGGKHQSSCVTVIGDTIKFRIGNQKFKHLIYAKSQFIELVNNKHIILSLNICSNDSLYIFHHYNHSKRLFIQYINKIETFQKFIKIQMEIQLVTNILINYCIVIPIIEDYKYLVGSCIIRIEN